MILKSKKIYIAIVLKFENVLIYIIEKIGRTVNTLTAIRSR